MAEGIEPGKFSSVKLDGDSAERSNELFLENIEAMERLPAGELEKLLEFKRQEALKKIRELYPVLRTIVEAFGQKKPKRHGNWLVFSRNGLEVRLDDYVGVVDVYWQKKHVFCNHDVSYLYRSGKWVEKIEELYVEAKQVVEKQRDLEKKQQLLEELTRFLPIDE